MQCFSASWLLPITSPPIPNGALMIDNDRIVDVGPREVLKRRHPSAPETSFKHGVILPGVINAHTHLELSVMQGHVPDGLPFSEWAYRVITERTSYDELATITACRDGIGQLIDCGTVGVGDIANHGNVSLPLLESSGLTAHVFHEVTGFQDAVAESRFDEFHRRWSTIAPSFVSHSITPHALYSVSPRLLRFIDDHARQNQLRLSIHLAESIDEVYFLNSGTGPMKTMIEKIGRWDGSWKSPSATPVGYAEALRLLGPHMMAVHAVHVSDHDIAVLRSNGVSVCLCPRSNRKIDVGGSAPVRKLIDAGINVCLGTDSLASNDDLNLWNEARALRQLEPSLSDDERLRIMTLNGATALGWEKTMGSIAVGKSSRCIVVSGDSEIADPLSFVFQTPRIAHLSPAINRRSVPDSSTR